MPVFRRKSAPDAGAATDAPAADDVPVSQQPKGRATPTRKEAEAARKAALTGPTDPKAAKRADRDAQRKARVEAREALVTGDENRLPARDRGPIKAWVRDRVDGRISVGEIFIPVAFIVLLLSFVQVRVVATISLGLWAFALAAAVFDSLYLWWTLRKGLAEKFPDADPRVGAGYDERGRVVFGTRGAVLYGVLRSLQLRMMRLPKPKVRWNGSPVPPKR